MKILAWNCYGIGNPSTVKALQDWCWRERPNVVFVSKIKIDSQRLELIRNRCSFTNGLCISSSGRSGGIGLWWNNNLTVNISGFSAHHICGEVCNNENEPRWRLVGIYEWPEATNKHLTWNLMRSTYASSSLPILTFGNFNEILGMHEKDGGDTRGERQIDAFREAIDDCDCRNLGYKGNVFTWQRGTSMETVVRERLDRYIASSGWCSLFPSFEVIHLLICHSDHAPILLKFGESEVEQKNGNFFRFEALWLSKEECGLIHERIARVAEGLSSWAAATFGVIKKKIKKVESRLKEAQRQQLDARRLKQCVELAQELISDLQKLEESYWHARSRSLKKDMDSVIASYFGDLFASSSPSNFDEALSGIENKVTEDMSDVLDTEPTTKEVKEALFQMHPNKAPELDGMHTLFFQKFWSNVGDDVVRFVKSWWRGGIDLSESAFVPKRLITDNALIAFEIFHAMKRKGEGRDGNVALKLDISKAYDRVEWVFIDTVMLQMGFRIAWINQIMQCLSSVSFSFKYNGTISGALTPSRGLQQGDPISPYLFLICAEAFSTMISKVASDNLIHGVKVCRDTPRVSHLFFADDSILFEKANLHDFSKIADIISSYERASGQKVNLSKTEVAFSKCVNAERRKLIVETLGVREVDRHEKYLGLPTLIGRPKKAVFTCLKKRIWKKLQGWKEKLLSCPGKEILIKAVAQAIPTYMMSIFRILDCLINEIHSILARFWWAWMVK
ncbi:uncharacterized protein LOC110709547 [Chenopodium quinoa]|uniref:uncharacterized protein LOC110709547 n=1 Tax=Chenopodium quinoa TaxID=63459 RepID=UPI000B7769AD|nr:uncharacterized protein LOC110709547 [Chenopodium quinoa]